MKNIFLKTVTIFVLTICALSSFTMFQPNQETRVSSWVVEGLTKHTDTVTYTKRVEASEIWIDGSNFFSAHYYDNGNNGGLCAPIAGLNLITYYDNVYTDLIPEFTPVRYEGGKKHYNYGFRQTDPVGDKLYSLMKTNQPKAGTSVSDFKSGLTSYVQSKGLKVKSESAYVLFGLIFSTDKYVSYIKQNKPVVIMTNSCDYIWNATFEGATKMNTDKTDSFVTSRVTKPHAMVAYGYSKYEYYRNEQVSVWSPVWYNPLRFVKETQEVKFRTDEYMMVTFGDGTLGYLNIRNSNISDAFTMEVYK